MLFLIFRYTAKKSTVYAFILRWPKSNTVTLGAVKYQTQLSISMLGLAEKLTFKVNPAGGIKVQMPLVPYSQLPCQWAWILSINVI